MHFFLTHSDAFLPQCLHKAAVDVVWQTFQKLNRENFYYRQAFKNMQTIFFSFQNNFHKNDHDHIYLLRGDDDDHAYLNNIKEVLPKTSERKP